MATTRAECLKKMMEMVERELKIDNRKNLATNSPRNEIGSIIVQDRYSLPAVWQEPSGLS
jgi:hypothetical protein